MDVFQWAWMDVLSERKKTVEATMAIEMIQKEMATGSFAFRKPWSLWKVT